MNKKLIWIVPVLIVAGIGFAQSRAQRMGVNGSSSGGAASSVSGTVSLDNGAAATPSLSLANSPTTGLYRATTNSLGVAANGSRSFHFAAVAGTMYGMSDNPRLRLDDTVGAGLEYSSTGSLYVGPTIQINATTAITTNIGIRLNTAAGAEPTCNAGARGTIWYTSGAGGVADKMQVCAKSSADAYAWRSMATIP